MCAVVGGGGAELDPDLHSGTGTQLVGVDAQSEPLGAARAEDRARLVGVERAPLAEDVDPAGVGRALLEHLPVTSAT